MMRAQTLLLKGSRISLVAGLLLIALVASRAEPLLETQTSATADFATLVATGPSVLLWSDKRDASDLMAAWVKALGAPGPGPRLILCADLSKLPFFVPRWSVKVMLSKAWPTDPYYLDYTGKVRARYGLPTDSMAVLVLGAGGELRLRVLGEASSKGASDILKALP